MEFFIKDFDETFLTNPRWVDIEIFMEYYALLICTEPISGLMMTSARRRLRSCSAEYEARRIYSCGPYFFAMICHQMV